MFPGESFSLISNVRSSAMSFSTPQTLLLYLMIILTWCFLGKSSLILLCLGCAFGYILHMTSSHNGAKKSMPSFQKKAEEIQESSTIQMTPRPNKADFTELAISPRIDASLNNLFDFVMRDFVHLYYDPLNPDKDPEFTNQVRNTLNAMAMNLSLCFQKLDKVDLGIMSSFAVSNTFIVHLREYRKYSTTELSLDEYLETNESSPFAHTTSQKSQAQSLRALAYHMFSRLLPNSESQSRILMAFLSELWANGVFQTTLENICDPDWINCTIVDYLTDDNSSTKEHDATLLQQLASSIDEELAERLKEPTTFPLEETLAPPESKPAPSKHDQKYTESPIEVTNEKPGDIEPFLSENQNGENSPPTSDKYSDNLTNDIKPRPAVDVSDLSPTPPLSPSRAFMRSDKSVSLQKILQNAIFAEFMAFLEEHDADNLLRFWLQADSFRKIASDEENADVVQEDALRIFRLYFDETAPHPITIVSDKLVNRCEQEILEAPTGNCFVTAQEYVFGILERDYFDDFIVAMNAQGVDLSPYLGDGEVKQKSDYGISGSSNSSQSPSGSPFPSAPSSPSSHTPTLPLTVPSPSASISSLFSVPSPDTPTNSLPLPSQGEERHRKRSSTVDNSSLASTTHSIEPSKSMSEVPEHRSRSLSTSVTSHIIGKTLENRDLDKNMVQNKIQEKDQMEEEQPEEPPQDEDQSNQSEEEQPSPTLSQGEEPPEAEEPKLTMNLDGVQTRIPDVSGAPTKYIYSTKSLAYMIEVEQQGSTGWILERSFSDFETMHSDLVKESPKAEKVSFPRLRLKRNLEACQALEKYLNILLSDITLRQSKPLQRFMQKDRMPNESSEPVKKNSLWTPMINLANLTNNDKDPNAGKANANNILRKSNFETILSKRSLDLFQKRKTFPQASTENVSTVSTTTSSTITAPIISTPVVNEIDSASSVVTALVTTEPLTETTIEEKLATIETEVSPPSGEAKSSSAPSTPTTKRRSRPNKQLTGQDIDLLIDTIFALVEEIFDLSEKSQWHLRKTVLSVLREVVRRSFARTIKHSFVSAIESFFTEEQAVQSIDNLVDSFWPNGTWAEPLPERTLEEKSRTKEEAKKLLLEKVMPDSLKQIMGTENSRVMIDGLVDGFLAEKRVVQGMGASILESFVKLVVSE